MGNDISLSYSQSSYSKTQGGFKETHSLDGLNRTILSTFRDNTNNITRYKNSRYDAYNRTIFSSIPSTSSYEKKGNNSTYDGLGRTIFSSSPVGSSSFIYRNQNRVNITDARGYITTNYGTAYGSAGNSFSVRTDVPSSSGTIVTKLNKNKVGKLLSVSQGGKTISYGYHPTYKDYVTSEAHPSFTIYTGVDKNGNTINKRVGSSATTYYTYNTVNQLTKTNYPSGTSDVNYTYRNTGELLTAKNGVGDITYHYNSLGNMTYRSTKVDGVIYGFSYAYDSNSNLESITYPNETVNYNPNLFGEAKQVGSYASNVLYEPTGTIKSLVYGNGLTYKGIVDSTKLRLGTIEVKYGSSTKIKKSYGYDANSNVSSITDGVKSNYTVSNFQYDGAERLTRAYSGAWGGTSSFTYDLLGNIKTKVQAGTTSTYNYASTNLLSSISGSKSYTFSYDAYGNVTYNGHNYFSYNDAGQLASASGGGTSKSFAYDALGNRVKAITNGNVEVEIFNDANQLMWVKDSSGVSTQKVYLGNRIIAQKRGTAKRFLHFDALGSVVATSDSSRNLTYEHYRPFGEKVANPTGTSNDQWYTAKQFDDELDIVYMQARYYDPVIGRFYSNDPVGTMGHLNLGSIQGFNRYAYGNNNPYRYIDPTGMAPEDIDEPKSQGNTEKAIEMISDFFSGTQESADTVQTKISEGAEAIKPSRETAHAVASVTAVGLTVASVTTPCTAICGGAATAISVAQATDHAIQGKPIDAALSLLPAGAGKLTTATFKATQHVSKAEAGAIVDATLSAVQIID
jgi:RHS repeat-associated protein